VTDEQGALSQSTLGRHDLRRESSHMTPQKVDGRFWETGHDTTQSCRRSRGSWLNQTRLVGAVACIGKSTKAESIWCGSFGGRRPRALTTSSHARSSMLDLARQRPSQQVFATSL
jgi:hypothetical protein